MAIKFDLDSIHVEENFEISSAVLSLYSFATVDEFENSSKAIYKSLDDWDENTIKWIKQPEIDFDSLLYECTNDTINVWENYDIRKTIREIEQGVSKNKGFIICCYGYGGGHFYSSEYRVQELRPKLSILISDNLSPKVDIISPNGGEIFFGGNEETIKWNASDDVAIGAISIYYSTNNGYTWIFIDSLTENTGEYIWKLPVSNYKKRCKIKIYAYDNTGKPDSDISDSVFTIDKQTGKISLFYQLTKDKIKIQIVNNSMKLSIPDSRQSQIIITDIKGRILSSFYYTNKKKWYTIPSMISSGIYFISIKNSNTLITLIR